MWKQSVFPSVVTASLGAKYLKEGGFISLPGAHPALEGTPGQFANFVCKNVCFEKIVANSEDLLVYHM